MGEEQQLDCALDLIRRMPPGNIEDNLAGLIDLAPHLTEELLSAVDQPLKIAHDAHSGRDYLLCDYNRDGDSYRSPWSNKYDPAIKDGATPSDDLRKLEIQMNNDFDIYRDLYYEGGVSSVYCWDLDNGFAAVILIKKTQDLAKRQGLPKNSWDSIHVIEVEDRKKHANYKLTSTVMLSIETDAEASGNVALAGSLTRQEEKKEVPVNDETPHVVNIGRMVEDMEGKLRISLETIYFGKTKEIYNTLRNWLSTEEMQKRKNFGHSIGTALGHQ